MFWYISRMVCRIETVCCLVVDGLGLELEVVSVMACEACLANHGVYPLQVVEPLFNFCVPSSFAQPSVERLYDAVRVQTL